MKYKDQIQAINTVHEFLIFHTFTLLIKIMQIAANEKINNSNLGALPI